MLCNEEIFLRFRIFSGFELSNYVQLVRWLGSSQVAQFLFCDCLHILRYELQSQSQHDITSRRGLNRQDVGRVRISKIRDAFDI